ncbi:hypothetical protein [Streptococcus gallolyticus]|uniref:hypothetical protein n=1 Tax=Streptococcus gallolyticus TaxID=315405 RepID=UPI000E41E621|nr:hypothetical protein [Streptococcus gallolyticus]RGC38198.1 hypothetical protein DXD73_08610 [Streptococcus gallolyticus]
MSLTKQQLNNIANEIFENLTWDDMEYIIFEDSETAIRPENSQSPQESEIIRKIPLSSWYWDSLLDGYIIEEDKDWIIYDLITPVLNGL